MSKIIVVLIIVLIALIVGFISIRISAAKAKPSIKLGIVDNRFETESSKPNWVSSFETDQKRKASVIDLNSSDLDSGKQKIIQNIQTLERTKLVKQDTNYLHFTFTSKTFGYIDDVEFLIIDNGNKSHIRSSSRTGYDDLGINKKRVEMLKNILEK